MGRKRKTPMNGALTTCSLACHRIVEIPHSTHWLVPIILRLSNATQTTFYAATAFANSKQCRTKYLVHGSLQTAATNTKWLLQQNMCICNCLPVFLAEPNVVNPKTHTNVLTETNEKKLKVQHDDKDVIVDVTTPPPPRKIKTIKCNKCYVC